jgi:poly(beta-D-mannuronate) lyase
LYNYLSGTIDGTILRNNHSDTVLRVLSMNKSVPTRLTSAAKYAAGVAGLLLLATSTVHAANEAAPSSKFDLLGWTLSVPVDEDGNGKSDQIMEKELSSGYSHPDFFYLAEDGGMVFKSPVKGAKTSKNTTYTRSELRGMLRRGDTSLNLKGVTRNNWVFSSAPAKDIAAAGGVDGTMDATLAVNHVTTTGKAYQVGRVVIGQIHANDDEPVRIYYRKLLGNTKGSLYYAHEPREGKEIWVEMVGSKSDTAKDPIDGIALNEKFSYRIEVVGNTLTVTLMRPGKADIVRSTDMSHSGYDQSGQYMYFKAGVYNQNKSGQPDDYAQATFYKLSTTFK